ncbi:unnamed protein product [Anisakis simplex]|uniref:Protein ced-11 n=1 Tax=Anisakis simplex TaxID=6269 RepID=A0A0M3JWJ7_ANISI|nr:unnamed protein product [Anisakis simplex]
MENEYSRRMNSVTPETVSILVENEWSNSSEIGSDQRFASAPTIQTCPAVLLASQLAIPNAVKYVYSRIAAYASQIDEGMPQLILSLIATGNSFHRQCEQKVKKALSRLIDGCNMWIVTSGEASDPLARITSKILQIELPARESNVETLVFAINDTSVVASDLNNCKRMVDVRYNTLCMLWMNSEPSEHDVALFRAITAIRLATPPPSLLIGVPDGSVSACASTQTVLLPPPAVEQHPIPIAFFCGGDLCSLLELRTYLQSGVPVLVLQDSSELCAILNSSWLLYRSSSFEHDKWIEWLDAELRSVAQSNENINDEIVFNAKQNIIASLAAASGDITLLSFISTDQLEDICERLLKLCMQSSLDATGIRRVLQLSVRLGEPAIVSSLSLSQVYTRQDAAQLYEEALLSEKRIPVLSALLDQNVPFIATLDLLKKMLNSCKDQCSLSGGINDLLPAQYFEMPQPDEKKSFDIIAVWAMLLNRAELVKCLCAYSNHTVPLSITLARVSHSLSHQVIIQILHNMFILFNIVIISSVEPLLSVNELMKCSMLKTRTWFFYDSGFLRLSKWLSDHSVAVLEQSHRDSPRKTYASLCMPLDSFNGLTLTELALQTNNKEFVAHRCCQRWVHRLLYANVQTTNSKDIIFIPPWLKIVLSSVFVLPIWLWVRLRITERDCSDSLQTTSPTVALLQNGRKYSKSRVHSAYSVISARSSSQRDEGLILSKGESLATPQSGVTSVCQSQAQPQQQETIILPDDVPDVNTKLLHHSSKRSVYQQHSVPITTFYSTPIVKFWLSLIFRLLHLFIFAYAITLPGCGSITLDTFLWIWTFIILLETVWVFSNRLHRCPVMQVLKWELFDISAMSVQLFIILALKLSAQVSNDYIVPAIFLIPMTIFPYQFQPLNSAYSARIASSFLLVYLCYSTLFRYIPLSKTFGPLMVRIKLMLTRDFVNFLILVALVMLSSAVAAQAIVYPDRPSEFHTFTHSLSWAWLSLFTVDLSGIRETDTCKKSFLGKPTDYCTAIGGYANHECPTQSWAGYFVIVEYLVLLKLICWPILLAFFTKTAREVNEEADYIWKYQLYSLVEDFRLRPVLPPPFTPIYFLGLSCCRATGCFSSFFREVSPSSSDHPDVVTPSTKSHSQPAPLARFGNVYQNPSVPTAQTGFIHFKVKSREIWSSGNKSATVCHSEIKSCSSSLRQLKDQMRLMIVSTNFTSATAKDRLHSWYGTSSPVMYDLEANIKKLSVEDQYKSWNVLIADYCPPFYCKPVEQFPAEQQKFVDCFTPQTAGDIRKQWRQRQQTDLLHSFHMPHITLSPSGLPLNPFGRKGIAGRGDHCRFGPNYYGVFVILYGNDNQQLKILLENKTLPARWRFECGHRDESLELILTDILKNESDITILSSQCQLNVGESDSGVAHVLRRQRDDSRDTDNSWTVVDVWGVHLGTRPLDSRRTVPSYSWHLENSCSLSAQEREFVNASLKLLTDSSPSNLM